MKLESTKYWKLVNHGYPKDTEVGEGDAKALALAIMKFWQRIVMGSRVEIQLYRSAEDRDGKAIEAQTLDSIADELFAGLV